MYVYKYIHIYIFMYMNIHIYTYSLRDLIFSKSCQLVSSIVADAQASDKW